MDALRVWGVKRFASCLVCATALVHILDLDTMHRLSGPMNVPARLIPACSSFILPALEAASYERNNPGPKIFGRFCFSGAVNPDGNRRSVVRRDQGGLRGC